MPLVQKGPSPSIPILKHTQNTKPTTSTTNPTNTIIINMSSHHEKKALKHQDKALKHQHKDKHHSHSKHSHHDKHHMGTGLGATTLAREGAPVVHTAAVPVVVPVVPMQGLSLADRVVHEPEQVIRHPLHGLEADRQCGALDDGRVHPAIPILPACYGPVR